MMQVIATVWTSPCRRQLVATGATLAAAVVIAVGVVSWAMAHRNTAAVEREAQVAALDLNSSAVTELASISSALPQRTQDAAALSKAGFGTASDRVTWVEQTIALLNRMRPLDYTMEVTSARQQPLPDALQTRYLDRGLEPPKFEVNDLSLRVQGLHEGELLRIIEFAAAAGGGVVRTEYCKIERRADGVGIDAECRLSRYSLLFAAREPPS